MIPFLVVFFGLAALLVVGGVRGSLHLCPHHLSTGQRGSGLRRPYAPPINDTTEDNMAPYYRKTWITLILTLVMLSVIIITLLNAVIHSRFWIAQPSGKARCRAVTRATG